MTVEKIRFPDTPVLMWFALIACVIASAALAHSASAQAGEALTPPSLAFQPASVMGHFTDQHAVVRSRSVAIDPAALSAIKAGESLTLNFFSNATFEAVVDKARRSGINTVHLQGALAGVADSSMLMVIHDGAVAGIIRAPDIGTYRIRSAPGRGQIVEEIDDTKFFPCGTAAHHAINAEPVIEPQLNADDGAVSCPLYVDIMIVYTPEARNLEGGAAPIQAIALLAIDATNAAYANSQINHFVRLVYVGEVDYVESGVFGIDIDRLRDPIDGFMDEVHALRDQYGADLVDLLVSHTEGGTICGVAYLMTSVSPGFEASGFSVCNTGCVSGGFVFEHEIGHNMGCHHDRDTVNAGGGGQGAFDFSFGHRYTGNNFFLYRTIMSYTPGNWIPYFSNPDVSYQGQPTGIAEGMTDPDGNPISADNSKTHNLTATTVAAFRTPAPSSPGAGQTPHVWSIPNFIQPTDVFAGDQFGVSVALDGDLMIIGAYTADAFAVDSGAAFIFRFDADTQTWMQDAKIFASDGAFNDRFGVSVDIHDDGLGGGLAVVGAYQTNDAGRDSGSAYVFRRSQFGWVEETKLLASDMAPGDLFGRSVSLSVGPAGAYVLVGAYLDDHGATNTGSAYVFRYSELQFWEQVVKLLPDDALPQDQFGFSVSIDQHPDNGELFALVGAWKDDEGAFDTGSAYLFRSQTKSGWAQVAKLTAPIPAAGDQFGYDVDIEITSSTQAALISAWQYDGAHANAGAAWVFRNNGDSWQPEARLTAADGNANDSLGISVAISGDAALVGAYLDDDLGLMNQGAAYMFRKSGFNWVQEAKILADNAADEDQFGFSVALQDTRAAIGAWHRDFDQKQLLFGAVYVSDGVPVIDCNANGVHDDCDIVNGTSQDANANGIPDECEVPTCPGDLTGDGVVNVSDLLAVINGWGACPTPPTPCPADIAPAGLPPGDGVVNVADLLAIINSWGACP